jgi:hypothetical protein
VTYSREHPDATYQDAHRFAIEWHSRQDQIPPLRTRKSRRARMAAIVYFEKVSEDELAVSYNFGPDTDQMARTLTFDKTTGRSTPQDDRTDHAFLAASRKISITAQENGTWPENGMHVS